MTTTRVNPEGEMTTDKLVTKMRNAANGSGTRIWMPSSDTDWLSTLTELDPLDPVDGAWLNRIFHALMVSSNVETMDALARGYEVPTDKLDHHYLTRFGVGDAKWVNIPLRVERQATT
jgi:hypothetical protein